VRQGSYVCTQWQQRAEKLYMAAADVANAMAQRH
jgi:hypothetical protein